MKLGALGLALQSLLHQVDAGPPAGAGPPPEVLAKFKQDNAVKATANLNLISIGAGAASVTLPDGSNASLSNLTPVSIVSGGCFEDGDQCLPEF